MTIEIDINYILSANIFLKHVEQIRFSFLSFLSERDQDIGLRVTWLVKVDINNLLLVNILVKDVENKMFILSKPNE